MNIKVSIWFLTRDSDTTLIADTRTIITKMTGNPAYPNPDPRLTDCQAALDAFATALANAALGGTDLTAIKKDKRDVAVTLFRNLASYVQVACNGDLTVLLSSGFPIQKPQRFPVGVLPAPSHLSIGLGARSGELYAAASPVTGASIYNWRLSRADAPAVIMQTAQTTAARNSFSELTPGVVYVAQVNAVGTAGQSDWSQPASQMVI